MTTYPTMTAREFDERVKQALMTYRWYPAGTQQFLFDAKLGWNCGIRIAAIAIIGEGA
jgi:hypothetical protein